MIGEAGWKISNIKLSDVRARLQTRCLAMKLNSGIDSLVLFLCVVGLGSDLVTATCLLSKEHGNAVGTYWYRCIKSSDYLADVKRAPVDVPGLSFVSCEIPTIRNRSFLRLGNSLRNLTLSHDDIKDIEDDAFEGLGVLESLEIAHNRLDVLKGDWFRGLRSLKVLHLQVNRIKRIEANFFAALPRLDTLDISGNHLSCLPVESLVDLRVKDFKQRYNPFTWTCLATMVEWSRDDRARSNVGTFNDLRALAELAKTCARELRYPVSEHSLGKCVEETSHEYLLKKESYTVAELCRLKNDKPSPFLDCD